MVLDTSLLNTQQYKVCIKGKVSNPGKVVAPSPTSQCSSYWKGSFLATLGYGRQLYFYLYIQGSLNKFPDFFHMGTFIDSTHMKL